MLTTLLLVNILWFVALLSRDFRKVYRKRKSIVFQQIIILLHLKDWCLTTLQNRYNHSLPIGCTIE